MVAQFTVKATNLEKAIYFLSVMSYSLVKIFCFPILRGNKNFRSRKWCGGWCPLAPFIYGPVMASLKLDRRKSPNTLEFSLIIPEGISGFFPGSESLLKCLLFLLVKRKRGNLVTFCVLFL